MRYKFGCIHFLLLSFLIALLTPSCQAKKEKKIVLIHSFEKGRSNYAIFNNALVQSFRKKGIASELHTFYLDCESHRDSMEKKLIYTYIDSIKASKPDIILVNDDQACYSLLACGHPFLKTVPIVFAGVNYPDWELIKRYPNVTGLHDKQDFVKNIEFIHQLFGQLTIRISCDRTILGMKALNDLIEQAKDVPNIGYNKNSFPLFLTSSDRSSEDAQKYLKNLLAITENGITPSDLKQTNYWGLISLSPYRLMPGSSLLFNLSGMQEKTSGLDIKYDHTSESVCQLVNYPSFSAHYESVQYNPAKTKNRYIGGYFTSMEIQAREQAQMASQILNGTPISQIPIKESEKEYILVWHAMKSWGLPVNKVPNYVRLVNVPFYELYKKQLIIGISVLFILTIIIASNLWLLYAREQKHKKLAQANLAKQNKELEIALDKAKESDHMKSAFLANMSHEIRTPLNAIVGFSNLLNADIEINKEEKEKFTELINKNSELLLNLINDILDLSRIESGRMSFTLDEYPLNDIMTTIYQTYQVLMPENVELRLVIPEESISIVTDKNRLTQVITNFINNAIKFTYSGHISIGYEYRELEQRVYIFVEDTGIGIPKEKQAAIFERFTKLDEFAKGTGLGLSICRVIAERLGGFIDVESELGKGSCFSLNIPLKPDREESN